MFSDVAEQDRWIAGELSARVDLATARTLRDDLAGTEDALRPVLAVGAQRRTEAVVRRLANLGRLLGSTRYRNAGETKRLGEAIEHFTAHRLSHNAIRTVTHSGPISDG